MRKSNPKKLVMQSFFQVLVDPCYHYRPAIFQVIQSKLFNSQQLALPPAPGTRLALQLILILHLLGKHLKCNNGALDEKWNKQGNLVLPRILIPIQKSSIAPSTPWRTALATDPSGSSRDGRFCNTWVPSKSTNQIFQLSILLKMHWNQSDPQHPTTGNMQDYVKFLVQETHWSRSWDNTGSDSSGTTKHIQTQFDSILEP